MGPLAGGAILVRLREIQVMIMQKRGEPRQHPETEKEKSNEKLLS
jgi:hypothetical protein